LFPLRKKKDLESSAKKMKRSKTANRMSVRITNGKAAKENEQIPVADLTKD